MYVKDWKNNSKDCNAEWSTAVINSFLPVLNNSLVKSDILSYKNSLYRVSNVKI